MYTAEILATVSDAPVARVLGAANADLVIGTSTHEFIKQIKIEAMRLRLGLEEDQPRDWQPDIEAAQKTLSEIQKMRAFMATKNKPEINDQEEIEFVPPPPKTDKVTLAQVDHAAAEFEQLWRRVKAIRDSEEGIVWDLTKSQRDGIINQLEKEAAEKNKKVMEGIDAAVNELAN